MPLILNDYLKKHLNALARQFYEAHGCVVPEGFDFSASTHPMERLMFHMAELAYDYLDEEVFNGDE